MTEVLGALRILVSYILYIFNYIHYKNVICIILVTCTISRDVTANFRVPAFLFHDLEFHILLTQGLFKLSGIYTR